jgi:hypothetical protein
MMLKEHIILSYQIEKHLKKNNEDDIDPTPQSYIQKFLYWFNYSLLCIAIIIIITLTIIVFIHKCKHPMKLSKKY